MSATSNKIVKLNGIKSKISSLSPYMETAITKLRDSSSNLAEGVILNYKAYDDGMLKQYASELEKIMTTLESIKTSCSNEIQNIYDSTEPEDIVSNTKPVPTVTSTNNTSTATSNTTSSSNTVSTSKKSSSNGNSGKTVTRRISGPTHKDLLQ